jgi:cellobiose phosphorylase
MNTYYEFKDNEKAIVMKRHDTPQPWINYLSNGNMHAFVSQAGGGFAWWKSAWIFRLTRYRAFHLPTDTPGFYIYVRHTDGTVWSPTFRPCETKLDQWEAKHQAGRSTFTGRKGDVSAKVTYFVAPDHDVLVWNLIVTNHGKTPVDLDLFGYTEFSQLNWETENGWGYYTKLQMKTWYEKDMNAVIYDYHTYHDRQKDLPLVFLASSEPPASFCGDRQAFMGDYRYEQNPVAVERNDCGNVEMPCGHPCGALQNKVTLAAGQSKTLNYFIGVVPGATVDLARCVKGCTDLYAAINAPGAVEAQFSKLLAGWEEHLSIFDSAIPHVDAQRQINIWTPINTVHTGRYSRAVNTWAPGIRGYGFRDSAQDMMSVVYRKPKWAEDMLCLLLAQQYMDGHVVHTTFPEEGRDPYTSIHSDDHLWLQPVARAIAAETGDLSFLQRNVPYLAADHKTPTGGATVWTHLLDAIRFTEANLGFHKIPLTLKSDWNDIIGRYNKRGLGQTVFAGQQYVVSLRDMLAIARAIPDLTSAEWLEDCIRRQEAALLACAWDGGWWRRGFDDDGVAVGSAQAEAGKLYLNPQSWAVLSGVGSREQMLTGMQAVADQLDTGVGLKILTPGFTSWGAEESKALLGYGPGCGENGAIFCHANTWAIMAEALLGHGTRAWKYFTQVIPHIAAQKVGIQLYAAEPYAWVSNIVGPENARFGYANVEQVTGTATWMDVAATQYLLGVRPEVDGLRIDPCVPADWRTFSISRRYRGCTLQIKVDHAAGVEKGVKRLTVEGREIDLKNGPVVVPALLAGRRQVAVHVTMG